MVLGRKLIRYIKKLPKAQRIQFIAALVLTVSLIFIIPSYAWYTSVREAAFITKVGSPIELEIKAGHQEAISNLDLSNIDVEETDSNNNRILEKDYIFCIKGQNTDKYRIQFAHTTNIAFDYTIYKTEELSEEPSVTANDVFMYHSISENKEYFYKKGDKLDKAEEIDYSTYHDITYKIKGSDQPYDKVQTNAEPKYWVSRTIDADHKDNEGYFCDYYILTISWNELFENNKETDMIYLIAEAVT